MIVSINQPAYLPWPGYFERIFKSDLHIILDHVQFEKNSLTNRNKIKSSQGWMWLTVPVKTKGKFKGCSLNELEINNESNWSYKHYQSFVANYKKAPFFETYHDFFKDLYAKEWQLLLPLLEETNQFLLKQLGIEVNMVKSSTLVPQGKKSDLVLELCQKVGADTYLSGPLGRDYLDEESFHKVGINIQYHDYQYPEYPQQFGTFEPCLSVVDLLLNCGPESFERLHYSTDRLKKA